jgi:SAM-dependent methyltransferase
MASLVDPSLLCELERGLVHFVFERYLGDNWRGQNIPLDLFRSFAAHAGHLSDNFTVDRKEFQPGYFRRREYRSAYLLYFHLASLVRTYAVLQEMKLRGLWSSRPQRVLEIGCGPAPSLQAAALACRNFGGSLEGAEGWDRESGILKDARQLWEGFGKTLKVELPHLKTKDLDLRTLGRPGGPRAKFDLIFLSNVLNEVDPAEDRNLCSIVASLLENALTERGKLIIIEPALNRVSRRLTLLRDEVLPMGPYGVPIPCGHMGPCPLNSEPRDWCHFEAEWEAPPVRRRLEDALDHRGKNLKYSYLVLEKGKERSYERQYRVLSNPLASREGDLVLLCAPERKIAVYYDWKSESGKVLSSLRRGDWIEVGMDPPGPGEGRVRRYAVEVRAPEDLPVRRL